MPCFAGGFPVAIVVQITGDFTEDEARRLAEALRFGALPLELVAQETRTVSATIGQDVLRSGVIAGLIGLTLVAVGTSLPELATTVMAALRKEADVALGNVIGSNMFNLLAIIGIATFVGPISVAPVFLQFDLWVMLAASLLLIPFVFFKQDITRIWGVILSALYLAYMVVLF